jgi:hypothetical protein
MQSQHSFQESIVNFDKEARRVALAYSSERSLKP